VKISSESLSLLQLTFVPLSVCVTAGLLYVDLGLELSYSSMSSGMSCLAFGPFIWLFIIIYVMFAFTSSDWLSSSGKGSDERTSDGGSNDSVTESYRNLGDSDRQIAENVLSMIFGCILLFISCIWLIDISTDASMLTIKRRIYSLFLAVSSGIYGACVIASSVPAVYTAPTSFFVLHSVVLRILEVCVVTSSVLFLLEEMNTPSGKPPFVRQGRGGGGGGGGGGRPISYPRGPRGVSFDPLWLNSSTTSPPSLPRPPSSFTLPSPSLSSPPPPAGKKRGVLWTSPRIISTNTDTHQEYLSRSNYPRNMSYNWKQSLSSVSSEDYDSDHYPLQNEKSAGHELTFNKSPFFPHNMSDIEEEEEWRLQESKREFMIQSPPLIPTASTLPPPRPSSLPRQQTTLEHSPNSVSGVSSTDTFLLSEPLWSLG
jgi:hypothetical protein